MKLYFLALLLIGISVHAQQKQVVYDAGKYMLYRDSIVQGAYVAKALSPTALLSSYKSPANEYKSAAISFKFSINGKDNEMKSGMDHHIVCESGNGVVETPVIQFGKQLDLSKKTSAYLKPNTALKLKLDMREVLNAFKSAGYYTTFKGEKIYKSDFKGVYVAGGAAPMTWDFDNLVNHPKLQLHDADNDGIYETELKLNNQEDEKSTDAAWKVTRNIAAFPAYQSEYMITDVLYNQAIEEMINAVEPDSTFRTGKEWAGVWTRDISYSIILSMAYLQPKVAMNSLRKKVTKTKKIIQDTGTGGAWPNSTDRIIWAVAAWELYQATGDKDWLQEAYVIIKNSIDADLNTIYDPHTGLAKGESSFLDWREQTYPRWMQPVDIAESMNLGTNAVHFQANTVLSKMAAALNKKEAAAKYATVANQIKKGINTYLWLPEQKYYAQYIYGRNYKIVSPRAEALGEALTVLFGIADEGRQKEIIAHIPVTDFGITCIFPQIPGIPPYHNNAVWPFVQTYWLWASAKAGNEKAVMESIAAIYRPAALFVTNKENYVADNGDFMGTQINSSNMLWSLSGNISIVHKVLFGINFREDHLQFTPFVPHALKGTRSLKNFSYRDAVLNIEMEGHGNRIKQFSIDSKIQPEAVVPSSLKGIHTIKIILEDNTMQEASITKVPNYTTVATPEVIYKEDKLQWLPVDGAVAYKVLKNGNLFLTTKELNIPVNNKGFAEYQVVALDANKVESFASEPVQVTPSEKIRKYEAEAFAKKVTYDYKGYSGSGFTEIGLDRNKKMVIPVIVDTAGVYAIDFYYANGNGPTNTENKCAVRTLLVDGKKEGTSLFPQRGSKEWSNWGFSNAVHTKLTKGKHEITLLYEDSNENMNGVVNQAMIDYLRIIKIDSMP